MSHWMGYDPTNFFTVPFQGMMASQIQFSKYTGETGFVTTTKEVAICNTGIDILQNVVVNYEVDDVVLFGKKTETWSDWFSIVWRYLMYFVSYLGTVYYDMRVERRVSSGENQSVACHAIRFDNVNVGQALDHRKMRDKYVSTVAKDIILFGISRGAATTFSLASHLHHNGTGQFDNRVRLVILEGCFTSVRQVLYYRYGRFAPIFDWLLRTFTQYQKEIYNIEKSFAPELRVEKFPHNIPIAFITSLQDKDVPPDQTLFLARRLATLGHANVFVLVLTHSSHSTYAVSHPEDQLEYAKYIHSLYKAFKLPYIEKFATEDVERYHIPYVRNNDLDTPYYSKAELINHPKNPPFLWTGPENIILLEGSSAYTGTVWKGSTGPGPICYAKGREERKDPSCEREGNGRMVRSSDNGAILEQQPGDVGQRSDDSSNRGSEL